MSDFTNGAHECFCDRQYKDANKLASCGDCPRDYIAGAWDARRKYIEEHSKMTDRYENTRKALAERDALAAEIEKLRAERDALARENEALKRCAIKYLGWLGVTHMPLDQALHDDMCNPSMCGDAALSK